MVIGNRSERQGDSR